MKNVTPRHLSGPHRAIRALFLLLGLVFTAWEIRLVWRQLRAAIRTSINRH
ncbi:MAG: hypothetical protein NTW21_36845 [Verrucomicrobia bacterium]|nr:hypothetical protein [Verrucomicrobiota bacterium]